MAATARPFCYRSVNGRHRRGGDPLSSHLSFLPLLSAGGGIFHADSALVGACRQAESRRASIARSRAGGQSVGQVPAGDRPRRYLFHLQSLQLLLVIFDDGRCPRLAVICRQRARHAHAGDVVEGAFCCDVCQALSWAGDLIVIFFASAILYLSYLMERLTGDDGGMSMARWASASRR